MFSYYRRLKLKDEKRKSSEDWLVPVFVFVDGRESLSELELSDDELDDQRVTWLTSLSDDDDDELVLSDRLKKRMHYEMLILCLLSSTWCFLSWFVSSYWHLILFHVSLLNDYSKLLDDYYCYFSLLSLMYDLRFVGRGEIYLLLKLVRLVVYFHWIFSRDHFSSFYTKERERDNLVLSWHSAMQENKNKGKKRYILSWFRCWCRFSCTCHGGWTSFRSTSWSRSKIRLKWT